MFESISLFFASAFAAVIILGSAWFWVTCIALFILVLAFEETDRYFLAGLSVLAFVWVMESSGAINIFTSPLTVAYWGAIYMALGAGWSFIKWFSFLHQRGDKLSKLKIEFIESFNARQAPSDKIVADVKTKIPREVFDDYKAFLSSNHYIRYSTDKLIPQITDNKAKVTGWIVWWPWSALWTLLNDPIRRIANAIYNQLQTTYQALANRVFAKFAVDEDEG